MQDAQVKKSLSIGHHTCGIREQQRLGQAGGYVQAVKDLQMRSLVLTFTGRLSLIIS